MTDQPPENQQAFQLLDDYLRRLHAGQQPDRDKLAQEHPELAPAMNCLDLLEGIASSLSGQAAASSAEAEGAEAGETVTWSSSVIEMPSEFGAYELLEEIGRGGMGVVYKARQKELDRVVALKMILASHLASPEHVRRFRAEAKAAGQLQHDQIVRIYDVGEVHGQHYFSMQYIEGKSLAQRVVSGPMDLEAAVRLVEQIARAVGHSHRQGIVHRDLKPKNILLDAEGRPYVADFGLAKVLRSPSDMTASRAFLGTASYMAPEQAAGRSAEATPASDVYSLGAILYELLTGRPPFREESFLDTLMQVLFREPTLPRQLNRHIPRALELICLKCLAKSPQERYPSAEVLADDLARFLKGQALVARPPSLGQRFWNWSRREPALAARLAVLAVFCGVESANYASGQVDWAFHRKMLVYMAVWAVTAVVFQRFLKSQRWSIPGRFVWGTFDSAILFAMLFAASGVDSPLIAVYPMLIVGSGLWFRVRFVWFMTALSLASYGVHVLHFYLVRGRPGGDLSGAPDTRFDRHVIFAVALIAIGAIVAYLVHRVRTLSSYYGQKPETVTSGQ